MSPDCQYVVAAGTYPPAVRVFDVQEMSMKFERRLTSEVKATALSYSGPIHREMVMTTSCEMMSHSTCAAGPCRVM